MRPSSSALGLDLVAGALVGLGVAASGLWLAAVGAGVPEEALTSIIGGWVEDGAVLILPGWVLVALGLGVAAAGAIVLWGVAKEASRRRGGGAAAPFSARDRSIAGLVLSVFVGAFFSLVGSILTLASAGVIATRGGGEPAMPWVLGLVGIFVALAALAVSFSSIYQWMGGTGAARHRRGP